MQRSHPSWPSEPTAPPRRALRVLGVVSGKGGTGKTNVAVNVAVALAARGRRVLLIDGDTALANADILLDVSPRHHLGDVLRGDVPIERALVASAHGVTLLPASSGGLELERLDDAQQLALLGALESLDDAFDVVVVDTGAGISPNSLFFAGASQDVVLVTTPEPTALVDTYATIKALARRAGVTRVRLVVNQAGGGASAAEVHVRLGQLARRFLDVQIDLAGWLPFDAHVHRAVMRRAPVIADSPRAEISVRLRALAEHLVGAPADDRGDRLRFFWRRLFALASPAMAPHEASAPTDAIFEPGASDHGASRAGALLSPWPPVLGREPEPFA